MDFDELKKSWQHLGATDPCWAILSEPGREGGVRAQACNLHRKGLTVFDN
ncbi:hypothetical protein LBMAG49_04140 [Planctomycetota bacterium]|nr:hypothetical protein LBMAG49_04140 [Planctomycetota bacterium]